MILEGNILVRFSFLYFFIIGVILSKSYFVRGFSIEIRMLFLKKKREMNFMVEKVFFKKVIRNRCC